MSLHPQLEQLVDSMLPFVKRFHERLQLAPHAASMDVAGEITGSALVAEDDGNFTVEEALDHFQSRFRADAERGEIIASAVFYFAVPIQAGMRPARTVEEAAVLAAILEHVSGQSLYLAIPFERAPQGFIYQSGQLIEKPPVVFAAAKAAPKPWWRMG